MGYEFTSYIICKIYTCRVNMIQLKSKLYYKVLMVYID